eukprot:scaffold3971_cov159-Amphora_coffeaeformis.AAC.4
MAAEHATELPLPMTAITGHSPSPATSSKSTSSKNNNKAMVEARRNRAKPSTPPRGHAAKQHHAPHPILAARRKDTDRDSSFASSCPLSPSSRKHFPPPPRPKLIFDSPRLEYEDGQLFPAAKELETAEQRWKYMSNLAADHQQDGNVLRLRGSIAPRSLSLGMPLHAADRVKELHLPPQTTQPKKVFQKKVSKERNTRDDDDDDGSHDEDEDDTRLPQWLDVVVQLFYNLQHLHLHANTEADESENSKRLRRLYILYRLPDLVSIDGVKVTETERRLARPLSPNGHRVSHNNWLKQRLAAEQEAQRPQPEQQVVQEQKPKRDTQAWLSEVLDEKKEADGGDLHKHVNVEVDLTGKLTESALTPPNKMMNPELVYETTSSVVGPDCGWAATCGAFFRHDSMRKFSKSRLRFSSSPPRSKGPKSVDSDGDTDCPITMAKKESVVTETEHLTVMDAASMSPILSKTLRPKGAQPPRLVLDASKGSPDRARSLIIKAVPPTAPPMPSPNDLPPPAAQVPSSENARCPPSRSLSSPFPIQFRSRSPPKRMMPSPQRGAGSPQRVVTAAPRASPERESKDGSDSPNSSKEIYTELATKSFTTTGLSKPIEMKRTKSTPSRKGKRDLPPPCPGGGRRFLRTITPRVSKSKSKFKKRIARNTSIIDDEVDSDTDEEEAALVVVGTAEST